MMKPARENLIPYALLAELTHRCPLRCPYCSNPLELERQVRNSHQREAVLDEAVAMGMLQVTFLVWNQQPS